LGKVVEPHPLSPTRPIISIPSVKFGRNSSRQLCVRSITKGCPVISCREQELDLFRTEDWFLFDNSWRNRKRSCRREEEVRLGKVVESGSVSPIQPSFQFPPLDPMEILPVDFVLDRVPWNVPSLFTKCKNWIRLESRGSFHRKIREKTGREVVTKTKHFAWGSGRVGFLLDHSICPFDFFLWIQWKSFPSTLCSIECNETLQHCLSNTRIGPDSNPEFVLDRKFDSLFLFLPLDRMQRNLSPFPVVNENSTPSRREVVIEKDTEKCDRTRIPSHSTHSVPSTASSPTRSQKTGWDLPVETESRLNTDSIQSGKFEQKLEDGLTPSFQFLPWIQSKSFPPTLCSIEYKRTSRHFRKS